MHALDATLSNLSKGLSAADYAITLEHIVEATSSNSRNVEEIASLLHLLKVVGLSAPEGMQIFFFLITDLLLYNTHVHLIVLPRNLQNHTTDRLDSVVSLC